MNSKLKSTIRHILTALGTLVAVFGLNRMVGIIEFVNIEYDAIWGAVEVIIGFVVTIYGFFRNKERLKDG